MSEFRVQLPSPLTLFCDKLGATYLSYNLVFHSCMKRIAISYHFVRTHIFDSSFRALYISTNEQLAHILSKSLVISKFCKLRSKIDITNGSSINVLRLKIMFFLTVWALIRCWLIPEH